MTTSVSYNILNLPSEVKFDDGHIVRYTYDAAGTKLKVEYLLGYIRVMDDWNTDRQPGKDVGGIKGINGISAKGFGGIGDLVSPPGSGMKEPITQMTLQYSAGHVYRNGRLERVDNPYGYWADGSFHYHITDYQGNIRAVIDEDGTLEEVNNYYPYGGLMGAGAMGVQPLKYGAKELDRENGLDLYDSHARFYDSMIGRTTSQDPLAEKYSGVSPYLWCAANPIRNIDEGGDSIAVLYFHGLVGHLALLIQNDDGKWAYYSMNGDYKYKKTHGKKGGKPYHDIGEQTFNSPSDFLNSDYNREGTDKEVQQDNINNYGYKEAFVIPTTRKQDKEIRKKFLQETCQSYNLVNRQCAQVVQRALEAGGIKTTKLEYLYFDDSTPTEAVLYMPLSTFSAIRNNYSNGKIFNRKIK